tara:strand:- start:656 stop:1312 length:657 start_codon:yes stop_codon:yes gene_type:complete
MKKLLSIVSSLMLVSTISAKAEMGMGISGTFISIEGDGTETTRQSGEVNSGSSSEDTVIPEIFVEMIGDNGGALGISYIPTRDVGSKSRTDAESPGDTDSDDGTYTAKAELDNVIKVYGDIPMGSFAGGTSYLTVGLQHVELVTLESLNSGATYPNKNLLGYSVGLGLKGDVPYGSNLYYKGEVTYTDFETYEADGAGNKVKADLDATAARFSIGYKF